MALDKFWTRLVLFIKRPTSTAKTPQQL